jgi:hypothetical protein
LLALLIYFEGEPILILDDNSDSDDNTDIELPDIEELLGIRPKNIGDATAKLQADGTTAELDKASTELQKESSPLDALSEQVLGSAISFPDAHSDLSDPQQHDTNHNQILSALIDNVVMPGKAIYV